MKKWYFLIVAAFLFASCGEDETVNEQSSEEVSAAINSLAGQMGGDIVSLVETEGVAGAIRLIELMDAYDFSVEASSREGVKAKIDVLSHYFIGGVLGRVGEETPSSFDEIKGLYEWNEELQSFDKSPSDFFVVRFPSEGSLTNNAELTISQLEFVNIIEDYGDYIDEYELPSVIIGNLKVDDKVVINLDFLVGWSSMAFPESAQIDLDIDPFSFTIGFNDTFQLSSSLVSAIELNGEVLAGIELDVEWQTSEKEEPRLISGFVQYLNLKIAGQVNTEFDGEESGIEEFVDLDLLLDNEKVGDIIFEEDIAYVQYADGSREMLEEMIKPIMDEIEELLMDLE